MFGSHYAQELVFIHRCWKECMWGLSVCVCVWERQREIGRDREYVCVKRRICNAHWWEILKGSYTRKAERAIKPPKEPSASLDAQTCRHIVLWTGMGTIRSSGEGEVAFPSRQTETCSAGITKGKLCRVTKLRTREQGRKQESPIRNVISWALCPRTMGK